MKEWERYNLTEEQWGKIEKLCESTGISFYQTANFFAREREVDRIRKETLKNWHNELRKPEKNEVSATPNGSKFIPHRY